MQFLMDMAIRSDVL